MINTGCVRRNTWCYLCTSSSLSSLSNFMVVRPDLKARPYPAAGIWKWDVCVGRSDCRKRSAFTTQEDVEKYSWPERDLIPGPPCHRGNLYGIISVSRSATVNKGYAMAQAVSRQPVTAEARVRSRLGPCGIFGRQSDTGTGFSSSNSVFPCQFHSTGIALHGKTKKIYISSSSP
jgi:hypothetical protein